MYFNAGAFRVCLNALSDESKNAAPGSYPLGVIRLNDRPRVVWPRTRNKNVVVVVVEGSTAGKTMRFKKDVFITATIFIRHCERNVNRRNSAYVRDQRRSAVYGIHYTQYIQCTHRHPGVLIQLNNRIEVSKYSLCTNSISIRTSLSVGNMKIEKSVLKNHTFLRPKKSSENV